MQIKYSVEASGDEVERLNRKNPFIKTLANAELGLVTVKLPGKLSDFTLVGTARVEGHLVGVYGGQCSGVDSSAERGRLSKRLKQIRSNIATLEGRLSNKGYADKAPPRLVQQTRNQLDEAKQMARALEEQLSVVSQP